VERIKYTKNRKLALNITQLSYQWYMGKHCHTRVHPIDSFCMANQKIEKGHTF